MRRALPLLLLALSCGAPQPSALEVAAPSSTPSPSSACDAPLQSCDADAQRVCETNTATSTSHCGRCNSACPLGNACLDGECLPARSLHAHGARGCAVVPSGVVCWGGQIDPRGDRAILAVHPTPVLALSATDVVSVSVSERAGCALHRTGRISCWMGTGPALEVPFIDHAVDLTVREQRSFRTSEATVLCASLESGALECAELGRDARELRPISAPKLEPVTGVVSGDKHVCVLHRSGKVSCWGEQNMTGVVEEKLVDGLDLGEAPEEPVVQVPGLSDGVQIAASDGHSCAVRRSGRVACWGADWFGQLGARDDRPRVVRDVEGIDDAVQVATGEEHTCVLRRAGGVTCFGRNESGQLGAFPAPRGSKVSVPLEPAVSVSAGSAFSCAGRASGEVACWGSSSLGRLGSGELMERTRPVKVGGISDAKMLAVGMYLSCVIDAKDDIVCWGADPTLTNEAPTVRAHAKDARALVAPDISASICALTDAGDLQCKVPPGLASTDMRWPVGASVVHDFRLFRDSLAVVPSGNPLVWVASKDGSVKKKVIDAIGDAVDIAGDGRTACVVRKTGRVSCFEIVQKSKVIADVTGLKDARSIVTTEREFCVVRATGDVACFRAPRIDGDKKAPPGTKVEAHTGLSDVTSLTSSGRTTCALKRSGEVWCWGDNRSGEAGLGDLVEHRTPTRVPGLSDVAAVQLAHVHGCALTKRGEVYCWGKNEAGQVDSNRPATGVPTPVVLP